MKIVFSEYTKLGEEIVAVFREDNKDVKDLEYKIQDAIERIFQPRPWWKTTKVKIFEALLAEKEVDPFIFAAKLILDIERQNQIRDTRERSIDG